MASPRAAAVVQRVDGGAGHGARASSSRPCEMSGRPQQPCGTSRAPMPARSRTSSAASPISGSECSVNVSAKSTARSGGSGDGSAPQHAATACGGSSAGGMRRRSMPSRHLVQSPGRAPLPATALDERRQPAAPARQLADVAERLAPWPARRGGRHWSASTSLLMRAMSTLVGHSLLQARHSRHRSSASCSAGSSRPCGPSCPVSASRSTLARPRVRVRLLARRHVGRAHGAVAASCGTRRRRCTAPRRGRGRRRSPKSKVAAAARACGRPARSADAR